MAPVEELNALLAGGVFTVMFVFARVGAAMISLPGFGDSYVNPQSRLFLALTFSVVVTPVVRDRIPAVPSDVAGLLMAMGIETIVGLFIGTIARILLMTLETAGQLIANQVGLSSASIFNPQIAAAGSLPGSLLSMVAVLLLFVTDLHHMMLRALIGSYDLFPPGAVLPIGDMSQAVLGAVAGSFKLGVQLSAPFIMVVLLLMVGLGLVARLMPQIQVFFIAQPLQLSLGLLILSLAAPPILLIWLDRYQAALIGFLSGGTG